jgi:hypothetical protein
VDEKARNEPSQSAPHVADQQQIERWKKRKTAEDEVRLLAEKAGYGTSATLLRFAYGSFVSPTHRYFYMETPKSACTALKHLIVALEGASFDEASPPFFRETRLDMRIHQRRYVRVPTLLDVDEEVRRAVLAGDPDWLIFAVVRNPFSRLVSVFENKVRFGEPGYRQLEAKYGAVERFGGPRHAFAVYVNEIVCDGRAVKTDAHLKPQTEITLPRLIPYTRLFHFEDLGAAIGALHAHIAKGKHPPPIELNAHNRSLGQDWRGYFDVGTAKKVSDVYRSDFESFGYDPDDWKPIDGTPELPAPSPREEQWRREVVARNAMIDELYDRLSVAKATPYPHLQPAPRSSDGSG